MHPIEHFFYFQCAWLPLLAAAAPALAVHPMHFLYALLHACIAPIAGHDGYAAPGGNSDYHYLHHAYLEVNYGVPCVSRVACAPSLRVPAPPRAHHPSSPTRKRRWPFDFDSFFGSWVEPAWCDKTRTKEGKVSIRRAKLYGKFLAGKTGAEAEAAALARVNADEE